MVSSGLLFTLYLYVYTNYCLYPLPWDSSLTWILAAIGINTANFVMKLVAWAGTGSHALFSEAVHSAADTVNQVILAYGLQTSAKKADSQHPYGYTNMQVSGFILALGRN